MQGLSVTILQRAGTEGKLYGSVGTVDIAEAVTGAGIEVRKQEVRLPEGPFRTLGEFDVTLQLHADVETVVRINIVAEGEE